jgi:flagellar FliJ protein
VNRLFRLGPVLRARKAQEDAARGAVIQSRAEIREAQQLLKRRQLDLAGANAPTEGTARAMVASMVARQSLAASLSGAHEMLTDAEELTREKVAELADAAKRRRAVELLAERHAETVHRHDLAANQASLDELTVTAKARNAARGVDAAREERANVLRHGNGTAADREAVSRAAANEIAAQRPAVELADAATAIAAQRAMLAVPVANPDKAGPAVSPDQTAADPDETGPDETGPDETGPAAKPTEQAAEVDDESTDDENRSRSC